MTQAISRQAKAVAAMQFFTGYETSASQAATYSAAADLYEAVVLWREDGDLGPNRLDTMMRELHPRTHVRTLYKDLPPQRLLLDMVYLAISVDNTRRFYDSLDQTTPTTEDTAQ